MDQPIGVFNWARIAFNEQTPWFLAEVAFRTFIMMILGLFFVRLIGRKAVAQLSSFEFLLIVMWGTVIGDPTFYEDVALTWSLVVLTTSTIFYRIINYFMNNHESVEDAIEGKPILVIRNGIIDNDSFKLSVVTVEDISAMLRDSSIKSYGEIDKAYLERSGKLSIFKVENPQLGLPTDPLSSPLVRVYHSGKVAEETTSYSSAYDGKTINLNQGDKFPPTTGGNWLKSI